ncbi:hypothetical protein NUW58_g1345 [Xylaria curta]|uniref:Uncharacterized protein n=1 Tax=Xylaria curta TaxID=42375 RepID=A0ACC1PM83_9PEZI|nr:hypothetical protein NUW58_g1345 [Xylaria curta]
MHTTVEPGRSSRRSASSCTDSAKQSLYLQLSLKIINPDDNKTTQNSPAFPFLPIDVVNEIVTSDTVQAQAARCVSICKATPSRQIAKAARQIFAILALCEKQSMIWNLFSEGVTDEHLPFSRLHVDGHANTSNPLVSSRGEVFKSFSKLKDVEVKNFLREQWLVLAPVLTTSGEHVHIDAKAPLPFYDVQKISHTDTSTVYRGMLHPAHMTPKTINPVQIAIKEYHREGDFYKEKDNLEIIQSLKHPHLIWHITTIKHGDLLYAIFPWADGGNLSKFWERDPDATQTRHPALFLWSLQQMRGLVDGLFALHELNCRHGDLKPENILHFQASEDPRIRHSQYGTLVIADVGVSRVHHQVTELRTDPTKTKATTPCYEAPEVELNRNAPRGRRYDMWSVGCLFMEFAIWLLYGNQAIGDFREMRNDPIAQKAAYYKLTTESTAVVHPVVSSGLEALRNDPRCGKDTGLADLVDLIAGDLIVIEPEQRARADELRDKFGRIVERAERDPDYLFKRTGPPSRVPDAFTLRVNDEGYG